MVTATGMDCEHGPRNGAASPLLLLAATENVFLHFAGFNPPTNVSLDRSSSG